MPENPTTILPSITLIYNEMTRKPIGYLWHHRGYYVPVLVYPDLKPVPIS